MNIYDTGDKLFSGVTQHTQALKKKKKKKNMCAFDTILPCTPKFFSSYSVIHNPSGRPTAIVEKC
jgi:hypothetical protein